MSGRAFLQIPGPTNVPERVLRAMDRPVIDHRGPRNELELLATVAGVEMTLAELGVPLELASGVAAAQHTFVSASALATPSPA